MPKKKETPKTLRQLLNSLPDHLQGPVRAALQRATAPGSLNKMVPYIQQVGFFFQLVMKSGTKVALKWADKEAPWLREGFDEAQRRQEQKRDGRNRQAVHNEDATQGH